MSEQHDEFNTATILMENSDGMSVEDPSDLPYALPLELVVNDRDVIQSLIDFSEGDSRNQYALEALKIGVIALRHTSGQMNGDLIRRESARLVEAMQQTLQQHTQVAQDRLASSLKEYFDPESGRFDDRVQRLVGKDGELAKLMQGQLDGENSQLARTLLMHVGRDSPLMQILDPQQSQGLLSKLRESMEGELAKQRDQVLKEFSLDNQEGALARLVRELTTKHGDLGRDLQAKIDGVVKEFSLDEENSALSRLVRNVDRAQRTITDEFSLNNEQSALSRFKKELRELMDQTEDKNQKFQEEVKVSLAKIVATREEAERSTRHGIVFEDALCEFLACQAQHDGDIATPTGSTVGLIKNCKVGDCVVVLGPDSPAPGAKIVVEAKEAGGYTLANALEEIEKARKNRGANWGLFVFSKKVVPTGLASIKRYGSDIVVIWDAEDPASDGYLQAGHELARALCFRTEQQTEVQQADFESIDRAILEIEKRANNLGEIGTSAETIQSSSKKILERVRIDRKALDKQVTLLREKIGDFRESLSS